MDSSQPPDSPRAGFVSTPPPGSAPVAVQAPAPPEPPPVGPGLLPWWLYYYSPAANAAIVAVAILLAAAGWFAFLRGGGDTDADDAITAVLVRAMTTSDPAICTESLTDRWLAENFSSPTKSPVDRCLEINAGDEDVKGESVTATAIAVSGNSAQATVRVEGGNASGSTLTIAMVNADGWRLDHLLDISIDRKAYLHAQRAADASSAESGTAAISNCMADYAAKTASKREIEHSILRGDESYLEGAMARCNAQFRAMLFSPARIATHAGVAPSQARCMARVASAQVDRVELERIFDAIVNSEPMPAEFERARTVAYARCSEPDSAPLGTVTG